MMPVERPLGVMALVAHARTVSSEAREQFADAARAMGDDPRVILLRTCHRVELYIVADDPGVCPRDLAIPAIPAGVRRLSDRDAVHHLFRVAAGLDSIVVGEDQILHQLRECLATRRQAAADSADASLGTAEEIAEGTGLASDGLQPALERLFQLALHVGRQTRAWREGQPRSLGDVALDRIKPVTGSLEGRPVLVGGAGSMSRLTALAANRRGASVAVSNRTADRAALLAADASGVTVPFGQLGDADPAAIVIALSGRWALDEDVAQRLATLDAPVVDLSSPPALDAAFRAALGSRYVSVDDIAQGPEEQVGGRVRRRMERLLDEAETEFARWIGARRSVPAIQALTERAETRRVAEVDRLMRRLAHLDDRDRELVEQMTHRLVASLLHAPLATLRDDQTGERERAARELFSL